MYDIYATELAFEQCASDKPEINVMIPYAVCHFVLSGEGFINGKKVGANTVFISFEDTHMHYYPCRENPWSYIYLRLRGTEVKKAFLDSGFSMGLTIRPFSEQEALFALLSLYETFSRFADTDKQKLIANGAFFLLKKPVLPSPRTSKPQQHMEQIRRFIDEQYYKSITMEEIAARFYLNKNYIRTIFARQLGISPKQYLQKVRMERAGYLLVTTEETVKLIANSVGYEDPLLFTKMFKRYYGCSPTRYRKDKGGFSLPESRVCYWS